MVRASWARFAGGIGVSSGGHRVVLDGLHIEIEEVQKAPGREHSSLPVRYVRRRGPFGQEICR